MFISIDGPDGAGKTTLAKLLTERLVNTGRRAVCTTEPTDTPLGQKIRRILVGGNISSAELLPMFLEDREEHIKNFIEPKEREGFIVITDRYKYSTVCYQHLQGLPLESLIEMNSGFKKPDISFILYADDVSVLLKRLTRRGRTKDFFETEALLNACNKIYKDMPKLFEEENIVMINAEAEAENVLDEMMRVLTS